jgi:alpha-galactosidase
MQLMCVMKRQMDMVLTIGLVLLTSAALAATPTPISLGDLDPTSVEGEIRSDRTINGDVLNIGEITYGAGIGMAVPGRATFKVPSAAGRFEAWVGPDITSSTGSARFKVLVDGQLAFDSGSIAFQQYAIGPAVNYPRATKVTVPVDGASSITLVAGGDQAVIADWGRARFVPADWPAYEPRDATSGPAATPPMGWNSWNGFGKEIDQQLIHEIADTFVEDGFREAGYKYLNLDDGWEAEGYIDDEGYPQYDKDKFPDGMKALGDYIHERGLKFGIYSTPEFVRGGGGRLGLWRHGNEDKHARTFAQWGVDYLKYDFAEKRALFRMGKALKAIDRPIFYNMCGWGKSQEWSWGHSFGGNSWRTTYDVMSVWHTGSNANPVGIMDAVDETEALGPYAGPGHWNDPDMLVIGLERGTAAQSRHQEEVTTLSATEQRTQMSLYSMLAAPLLIGADIRDLDETARETLLNEEIIAINQDPLGVPAWRAVKLADQEVWKRPLKGGDYALAFVNRGERETTIAATWRQLNLTGRYQVRDVWQHENLGDENQQLAVAVASHETVVLRLTPVNEEESEH